MSALGQKQTYAPHKTMSALPQERTCALQLVMSAKGKKRTFQRTAAQSLGGACNACIDFATKRPEIDGLGKERFGASLQRLALGLGIAISGDHDDRHIGSSGLRFRQEFKTRHPRHIDVGQNEYERHVHCISDALERHAAGLSKIHPETTLAQIAPELLPKQHLDIRFIVDHEDEKVHRCVPIGSKTKTADALQRLSPSLQR